MDIRKAGRVTIRAGFLMCTEAIGSGALPTAYFGVAERFSVFAAAGFTAVLGYELFIAFDLMEEK